MAIYLDYNATTPVDPAVCETISATLCKMWGNPSSSYFYGTEASNVIRESRKKVATMVGCCADEIIFTSGGTESNNMVIHSTVKHFKSNEIQESKPHIVSSNIEHDSVRLYLETLVDSKEIEVTFVSVSKATGSVNAEDVISAVRPNTCLVTIMLANNETGVIQPIEAIGHRLKELTSMFGRKIFLHTDAAQAIGKIPVNVQELGVDYLTIVGHKFYAPRIGALYFREGVPLHPLFYGGGQERNYRPGTENTCMIAGLGKACELVSSNLEVYHDHMTTVSNYLQKLLKKEFGDKVVFNVAPEVRKLPNTLSVAFDYDSLSGSDILANAKEICASTGAACHSSGKTGSSVLVCSGVPRQLAMKSLRLSVGRETSKEDIDKVILSLIHTIAILNKL